MSELKKNEKTELKKVAKAIEFGVDIKKLEREITTLESKKIAAINELSEMKNSVNKNILEDRKLIAKEREEFDSETARKEGVIDAKSLQAAKEEKQAAKKQAEFSNLQSQIEEHNSKVLAFEIEKKEVEKVRTDSLGKQNEAELTIEQFETKIKELDGKLSEVDEKLEEITSNAK